jgi:hypothetical protein
MNTFLAPYHLPVGREWDKVVEFTMFDAPAHVCFDRIASLSLGHPAWRINQAFKFYIGEPHDHVWGYVPAGYLYTARYLRNALSELMPVSGSYGQALILHELLCEYLTVCNQNGTDIAITHKQADQYLHTAMRALTVPCAIRRIVYAYIWLATWIREFKHGPTAPSAYSTKRVLENHWHESTVT